MNLKLVSVIMSVHNDERTVEKSIESILEQDYDNLELLLIDDGSSDSTYEICKKYDLLLIEDNCESLGAKYDSKYTGTFGVASSHSFYFSHHLQTIEGGMISTDDKDIYEFCKSLRSHGWTRELDNKNEDDSKSEYISKFKNSFPPQNEASLS